MNGITSSSVVMQRAVGPAACASAHRIKRQICLFEKTGPAWGPSWGCMMQSRPRYRAAAAGRNAMRIGESEPRGPKIYLKEHFSNLRAGDEPAEPGRALKLRARYYHSGP